MSGSKPLTESTVRGAGRERGNSRGRYRSRNRGSRVNQITAAKRSPTIQITGEGTDDIIVAAPADKTVKNAAELFLSKDESTVTANFVNQGQVRLFVHSCLLNLSNHHDLDTSNILARLSSKVGCELLSKIVSTPMGIRNSEGKDTLSFQYVILPLIGVLTREHVYQSMMSSEIGRIYSTVYLHHAEFMKGVLRCMRQLQNQGFLRDDSATALKIICLEPFTCQVDSFRLALLAIVWLVYQLFKRVNEARAGLASVVEDISMQYESIAVMDTDSPQELFASELLEIEVTRLQKIVADSQHPIVGRTHIEDSTTKHPQGFDPPGHISPNGPRHNNDKSEISEISLIPTQNELACSREPFLPSNGDLEAPHFLPPGWKRHLDIHFRLYREDLVNPLRNGLLALTKALRAVGHDNYDTLLNPRELKKHHDNNTNLNFYGGVRFLSMDCERPSKGSIVIEFPQPQQIRGGGIGGGPI
ncbi:hypothetical protein BGX26_002265 [Mortierella sp. AD094]|nr:hypothetical protein BGX26_002265 [Mortierella sp. AD094]